VVGIRPDRGLCLLNLTQPWSSRKFKEFAIMKAMGHADMKTTMIYVDVGKPHIREQVEKLDRIMVPRPQNRMKALAALTSSPWSIHPNLRVRILPEFPSNYR